MTARRPVTHDGNGAVKEADDAILLPEVATPATPGTGVAAVYPKANGRWYRKDDAGQEEPATSRLVDALGSRFSVAGHSLVADPGLALEQVRGLSNILSGLMRGQDNNVSKGGAVLSWHERGTTGDGGWPTVLNRLTGRARKPWNITRALAYSAATQYVIGDGVTNAQKYWVARRNVKNVTPVDGSDWVEVDDDTDPGCQKYLPVPQVPVFVYGNNDLGWGRDLAVFQETLRSAIAAVSCGQIFGDDYQGIGYTGGAGWAARQVVGPRRAYNGGYRAVQSNTGAKATFFYPPDIPDGSQIYFFFVVGASSAGTVTIEHPSGTVRVSKNMAGMVSTNGGATQDNLVVVPYTFVKSRGGQMAVGVSATPVTNVWFTAVGVAARPLPPVAVVKLFKPMAYDLWPAGIGDSDVNTWNAGIDTVAAEFTNVCALDIDTLGKSGRYFGADKVHPNDEGNAVMAANLWTALLDLRHDAATAALCTAETQIMSPSDNFYALDNLR